MSREDPQLKLRLPSNLKDMLTESAHQNGRSLNAEIVSRLVEVESLRVQVDRAQRSAHLAEVLRERAEQEQAQTAPSRTVEPETTLYVALDAGGHPISWSEIMAHLNAIARGGKLDPQKVEARIFDPELIGSDEREDEWWNTLQYYRKLLRTPKSTKA